MPRGQLMFLWALIAFVGVAHKGESSKSMALLRGPIEVPYSMSSKFNKAQRSLLLSSLKTISDKTCITFKSQRNPNKVNFKIVKVTSGCGHSIGIVNGKQMVVTMRLSSKCFKRLSAVSNEIIQAIEDELSPSKVKVSQNSWVLLMQQLQAMQKRNKTFIPAKGKATGATGVTQLHINKINRLLSCPTIVKAKPKTTTLANVLPKPTPPSLTIPALTSNAKPPKPQTTLKRPKLSGRLPKPQPWSSGSYVSIQGPWISAQSGNWYPIRPLLRPRPWYHRRPPAYPFYHPRYPAWRRNWPSTRWYRPRVPHGDAFSYTGWSNNRGGYYRGFHAQRPTSNFVSVGPSGVQIFHDDPTNWYRPRRPFYSRRNPWLSSQMPRPLRPHFRPPTNKQSKALSYIQPILPKKVKKHLKLGFEEGTSTKPRPSKGARGEKPYETAVVSSVNKKRGEHKSASSSRSMTTVRKTGGSESTGQKPPRRAKGSSMEASEQTSVIRMPGKHPHSAQQQSSRRRQKIGAPETSASSATSSRRPKHGKDSQEIATVVAGKRSKSG